MEQRAGNNLINHQPLNLGRERFQGPMLKECHLEPSGTPQGSHADCTLVQDVARARGTGGSGVWHTLL